jgi:hypothetical protein
MTVILYEVFGQNAMNFICNSYLLQRRVDTCVASIREWHDLMDGVNNF